MEASFVSCRLLRLGASWDDIRADSDGNFGGVCLPS